MNGNNTVRFSDIEPLCLLRRVLRNIWLVIMAFLIFAMSAALFCGFIRKPSYTATMTYAVTSKRVTYGASMNVNAAREVAAVFSELIGSDMISDTIRRVEPNLKDFDGKLSASRVGDSNFIVVTASSDSPRKSLLAIRTLAEKFPELSDYISKNASVTVLRNPTASGWPTNSVNTKKISLVAGAGGAVLMILILCAFAVYGETIQTRSGARHLLDCNVITTVNHEKKHLTLGTLFSAKKQEVAVFSPTVSFAYTEAIGSICTQLEHEKEKNGSRVFLITSVGANEGKSTIAGNVAVGLAAGGAKVALMDTDFRNPSQNKFFGNVYSMPLPLNRLLAQDFTVDKMGQCVHYSHKHRIFMLFSDRAEEGATELLTGPAMPCLMREMSAMDYVIIDSPPMGMFPDAEVLAALADASLLVVRQDRTPACDINDAVDALRGSKSAFLGCVLNDMMTLSSDSGYGYGYGKKYGYGYKYGYGSGSSGSGTDAGKGSDAHE